LSLESGKKLGFTASIINIVVPAVMGIVLIAFYAALFSEIFTRIQSGATTAAPALAGTGIFLALLGFAVVVGIIALAGYILFLVAMHRLSNYYNERSIFSNLLRALIIQIVTSVVLTVVVLVVVFSIGGLIATSSGTTAPAAVLSLLGVYAVVALAGFVLSIYCAVLYKRSFDRLSERSGVDSFRTAGLLYLIGAILNIVAVGSIIMWIAWIFAALGYRKLQPLPAAPAPFIPPYQPGTIAVKRCPTCGAENSPDAVYCRNCGRLL
jgi:uncharacterized membrane protein